MSEKETVISNGMVQTDHKRIEVSHCANERGEFWRISEVNLATGKRFQVCLPEGLREGVLRLVGEMK